MLVSITTKIKDISLVMILNEGKTKLVRHFHQIKSREINHKTIIMSRSKSIRQINKPRKNTYTKWTIITLESSIPLRLLHLITNFHLITSKKMVKAFNWSKSNWFSSKERWRIHLNSSFLNQGLIHYHLLLRKSCKSIQGYLVKKPHHNNNWRHSYHQIIARTE